MLFKKANPTVYLILCSKMVKENYLLFTEVGFQSRASSTLGKSSPTEVIHRACNNAFCFLFLISGLVMLHDLYTVFFFKSFEHIIISKVSAKLRRLRLGL